MANWINGLLVYVTCSMFCPVRMYIAFLFAVQKERLYSDRIELKVKNKERKSTHCDKFLMKGIHVLILKAWYWAYKNFLQTS